jgi:hypothetical protein
MSVSTPGTRAAADAERSRLHLRRPAWTRRTLSALTRAEWAFLGVLLLADVYFLAPANTNTISRYDMVYALAHGTAIIDSHAANTIDVSAYNGHFYSPRSLGLSLLAVPVFRLFAFMADRPAPETALLTAPIYILNLFTVVPVAVAAALVFARFVARLRPTLAGTPLPLVAATAFALGTLFFPFAAVFFSHAFAGGLAFLGFYLLYRARASAAPAKLLLAAGLLAGFAVISEYPAAVIATVLCAYVWAVFPGRRWRALALFVAGTLPSVALLGWYNTFAFGNPFHLSYEFVAGSQFAGQHSGLFGITFPSLASAWEILVWPRGLLVNSPLLALVPLGLYRWLRAARPRAEAVVCLVVCVLYPLLISSYFLPMAGENLPGPRLLVPMLPFACLALAWVVDDPRRWPRALCAALLAFGVVIAFLWVALGVREYHTYPTYPVAELFVPILTSGVVPPQNGLTPPNLGALALHLPQLASVYAALIPLLAWLAYVVSRLFAWSRHACGPAGD